MPILNQQFYNNLDKKIDAIPSKKDAEDFIKQAFAPIQKQLDDTIGKLYNPLIKKVKAYTGEANVLLTLMNPPQDPLAIIPWVNGVVQYFTARLNTMKVAIGPSLDQYETAQNVLAELPAEYSKLKAHLERKIKEKGWDLQVPSILIPTLPPLPPIPPILKS